MDYRPPFLGLLTPHIQYFEISIPPICNCEGWGLVSNYVWSKKWKLLGKAEIYYLDQFEYAFNGDIHFFYFLSEIPFFGNFGPKKKLSV